MFGLFKPKKKERILSGERINAIGDIHGCYEKLEELLSVADVNLYSEKLVFLGDYIDRGPQTYEVIQRLIELKRQHPDNVIFLKGNHEKMLEMFLSGEDRFLFLDNGGNNTLDSYMQLGQEWDSSPIPPEHALFFSNLRLYYESEDYIFVHAGLRKGVPLEKQTEKDLLWIRSKFIHTDHDFGKPIIFGHTPFPEPYVDDNKIGIDTGAVYGKTLTCVKLPNKEFISV